MFVFIFFIFVIYWFSSRTFRACVPPPDEKRYAKKLRQRQTWRLLLRRRSGREDTRRQSGGRSVWMSYGRAMERLNEQRDAASPPARVSRHNSGDWRREEKKKWWRLDARRRAGGLCEGSRRTRRRWRLRGRCPHYSPPPPPHALHIVVAPTMRRFPLPHRQTDAHRSCGQQWLR